MSHISSDNLVRVELQPEQLLKLLSQRQIVASDLRCCDPQSRHIMKRLLLECTAQSVINDSK